MVIILNGAGSSGKSTLAQRLMVGMKKPTVYHGFDFLIPTLLPHEDSFKDAIEPDDRTYIRRLDKDLYKKMHDNNLSLLPLIYEFIVPLHKGGFNVIVDTLLIGDDIIPLFTILNGIETYFVGVICSLEELQRRELQRKDRHEGQAEWAFRRIHENKIYDIEVDTSKDDVRSCTQKIIEYIGRAKPTALSKMMELYNSTR